MDSRVIALAGEKEVGKDTFAVPFLDRGFRRGAFADNLKEMCRSVFGLSTYHTDSTEGKERLLETPRRIRKKEWKDIVRWISRTHELVPITDKLREMEEELVVRQVTRTGKPLEFRKPRKLLQFVGTEICRELISSYHVDVLIDQIRKNPGNWVITDARFPNERERLVREFGATLVRIKRPGTVVLNHASENSLGDDEGYDLVVNNNGTIEELHKTALKLL